MNDEIKDLFEDNSNENTSKEIDITDREIIFNTVYAEGLNHRELEFCYAYIELNGQLKKAAIAAGYAEKSAGVTANLLLKKEKIQNAIRFLTKTKVKSNTQHADRFLEDIYLILEELRYSPRPDRKLHLECLKLLLAYIKTGHGNNQEANNIINMYFKSDDNTKSIPSLKEFKEELLQNGFSFKRAQPIDIEINEE